jgi:Co/Zn/Cd efflux system component
MRVPMDDCCATKSCEIDRLAEAAGRRSVLQAVLAINAAMFAIEFGAGVVAGSSALMADSVDMLGDAFVYGLSLFALGRGTRWGAGVKGALILGLAAGILGEVAVKLVRGAPPSSTLMLAFGGLALAANLACLALLWRFRRSDVNMSSTFECSRNDVISNIGVLVAAAGVAAFVSPWPDIAVGAFIAAVLLRSGARVLRNAWPQFRAASARRGTPQPASSSSA